MTERGGSPALARAVASHGAAAYAYAQALVPDAAADAVLEAIEELRPREDDFSGTELLSAARDAAARRLRAGRTSEPGSPCELTPLVLAARSGGTLEPAESAALDTHLGECAQCAGLAARFDAAEQAATAAVGLPLPSALVTSEGAPAEWLPAALAEAETPQPDEPVPPEEWATQNEPAVVTTLPVARARRGRRRRVLVTAAALTTIVAGAAFASTIGLDKLRGSDDRASAPVTGAPLGAASPTPTATPTDSADERAERRARERRARERRARERRALERRERERRARQRRRAAARRRPAASAPNAAPPATAPRPAATARPVATRAPASRPQRRATPRPQATAPPITTPAPQRTPEGDPAGRQPPG